MPTRGSVSLRTSSRLVIGQRTTSSSFRPDRCTGSGSAMRGETRWIRFSPSSRGGSRTGPWLALSNAGRHLADEATNTYGGIYLWRDSAAAEAFLDSDLSAAVRAHPNIANLNVREFAVLADVSRITQPELEVIMRTPTAV